MSFHVVIPARYESRRLPGKPLLDLGGKPMIQRVYEQASASAAESVIVATDDERILEAVRAFGGEARMTSRYHPSGTDRLQETATLERFGEDEVIVNVQGDEPLIPPEVIDQVAANLIDKDVPMATLSEPIEKVEDVFDPNVVKVVTDEHGMALYFSRAPIPWLRDEFSLKPREMSEVPDCRRHLGIYAYRVSLLNRFVSWGPAPPEQAEQLEQLRVLWHGLAIHVARAACSIPPGIDTEQDLRRARESLNAAT